MKKAAFLKLMEKYPADAEITFKINNDHYYTARVEVEQNFDVEEFEGEDYDIPLKDPRIAKRRYTRIVIE